MIPLSTGGKRRFAVRPGRAGYPPASRRRWEEISVDLLCPWKKLLVLASLWNAVQARKFDGEIGAEPTDDQDRSNHSSAESAACGAANGGTRSRSRMLCPRLSAYARCAMLQ